MGFNSVLFVLNDALSEINRRPKEFSELISNKMGSGRFGEGDFGFGMHVNGFSIPHIGHADEIVLLAVGRNHVTKLVSHHWLPDHSTAEGQEVLLKALASNLGYSVSKKTTAKGDKK